MPSTIQNFDQTEDEAITARGLEYYKAGAVSSVEETADGEWEGSVMGTDLYSVAVNLKKSDIYATGCDCRAFDDAGYCKHVAAVLFAIRDRLAKTAGKPAKVKKEKIKPALQALHDVVSKAEDKDLREFIKSYAARNKDFADDVVLHFKLLSVLQDTSEESFKELVKYAVDNSAGKTGIDSELLTRHLRPVMVQAQKYMTDSNYLEAFYIIKAILEIVGQIFSTLDYQFKYYANAVTESIDLLERIASLTIPPMFRDELFDYSIALAEQPWLTEPEYDRGIMKVLPQLANDNARRQRILTLIDTKLQQLIPSRAKNIQSTQLKKHLAYLQDKKALLTHLHRDDEAEKLIKENLYYHDELRHEAIAKGIEWGDAAYVRHLIKEKLAGNTIKVEGAWHNQDRENQNWQPYYIDVAILENNIPDVILYAETLFKSTQDIRYYNILKKYYPTDKWHKKFEELESGLFRKHYSFGILATIYVEEGKIKDLFELLKKHAYLNNIHDTIPLLLPKYGTETLLLYNKALISLLQQATVAAYKQACEHLKYLVSLEQKETVQNWIETFKSIYSNRPRLLKELGKVKV